MKNYFRILGFAKPLSSYLPVYFILVLPGIVFGAFNFTLLIPLLDILFNNLPVNLNETPPTLSLSAESIKDLFYYYMLKVAATDKARALWFICSIIILSVFLSNFFKWLSQTVLTRLRTVMVYRMRKSLFEKLSSLHLGYFHKQRKGDQLSIISSDVQEIENSIVSSIQIIFRDPLIIVVYFIMLFIISFKLTLFTLIMLPFSAIIITTLSKKLKKQAVEGQFLLGRLMSQAEELISGIRIVKAFRAEKILNEKYAHLNDRYRRVSASMINRRELASPVSEFLGVSVVVGVVLYGGQMVLNDDNSISASAFITYLIFYSQILSPAKNISAAIATIQRGLAAGERVFALLDVAPEVTDSANPSSVNEFKNELSFENVSYAYSNDGVLALNNIDLRIKAGSAIALVGRSGSGKTTLADLAARFYDPTKGVIRLDGTDLKQIKSFDYRGLIGVVSQEAILFNDTVFNNIAFGFDSIPEEEVVKAAKVANAHEFILQLKDGYQTEIGDRGQNLSGGQRQRLSIARAVLKNPPILILDEATSALDTESEKLVQEALNNLMKHRTSIIIAHRLSTIQHADEIIVLEKGSIAERGSHTELYQRDGIYRKLVDMQAFES